MDRFAAVAALLFGLVMLPAEGAVAGTLCGTVRDGQTNAPVAQAGIFLRTPAGAYTGIYGATDGTGAFCINNIPPATYDVEVRVDDYRVAYVRGVIIGVTTGVDIAVGGGLDLGPPVPNPARDATRFGWTLPAASRVRLSIFDVRGRLVRAWGADAYPAGTHSLVWNLRDAAGRPVPPGIYFLHLEAGGAQRVRLVNRIR